MTNRKSDVDPSKVFFLPFDFLLKVLSQDTRPPDRRGVSLLADPPRAADCDVTLRIAFQRLGAERRASQKVSAGSNRGARSLSKGFRFGRLSRYL